MPIADTDICNLALLRVGQKQFITSTDITVDTSTSALLCSGLYPLTRDAMLAEFDWPFARKQAVLSASSSAVRDGWLYVYDLPADCLEPGYIWSGVRPGASMNSNSAVADSTAYDASHPPPAGAGNPIEFSIEDNDAGTGRVVLTDQANAELVYTARVTNAAALPQLFVQALAWRMASELASGLPVKPALGKALYDRYLAELPKAWAQALRAQREDIQPDSEIIAVRG